MSELSVVMPAYNEVDSIAVVARNWTAEFDRLGIEYTLTVYDDGSADGTEAAARAVTATQPRLTVKRHANMGHGPTIMRGYREAAAPWIFQVDSDYEMRPAEFEELWRRRERYDLLLGRRVDRTSPFARRVVTLLARTIVRGLFGSRIRDVNTPYRLIRRSALDRMVARIPASTFAPNVIMSGLAVRDRLRIFECPVRSYPRAGGVTSLSPARAMKMGWRCFREAASVRFGRT